MIFFDQSASMCMLVDYSWVGINKVYLRELRNWDWEKSRTAIHTLYLNLKSIYQQCVYKFLCNAFLVFLYKWSSLRVSICFLLSEPYELVKLASAKSKDKLKMLLAVVVKQFVVRYLVNGKGSLFMFFRYF